MHENRFYVELSEIDDAETLRNLKEIHKDALKTTKLRFFFFRFFL